MQMLLNDENHKAYFDELILIARRLAEAEIRAADEKFMAAKKLAETEKQIAAERFAAFQERAQQEPEKPKDSEQKPPAVKLSPEIIKEPEEQPKPKNTLFATSPARVRQILDEAEASSDGQGVGWQPLHSTTTESTEDTVRRLIAESTQEAVHFSSMQSNL